MITTRIRRILLCPLMSVLVIAALGSVPRSFVLASSDSSQDGMRKLEVVDTWNERGMEFSLEEIEQTAFALVRRLKVSEAEALQLKYWWIVDEAVASLLADFEGVWPDGGARYLPKTNDPAQESNRITLLSASVVVADLVSLDAHKKRADRFVRKRNMFAEEGSGKLVSMGFAVSKKNEHGVVDLYPSEESSASLWVMWIEHREDPFHVPAGSNADWPKAPPVRTGIPLFFKDDEARWRIAAELPFREPNTLKLPNMSFDSELARRATWCGSRAGLAYRGLMPREWLLKRIKDIKPETEKEALAVILLMEALLGDLGYSCLTMPVYFSPGSRFDYAAQKSNDIELNCTRYAVSAALSSPLIGIPLRRQLYSLIFRQELQDQEVPVLVGGCYMTEAIKERREKSLEAGGIFAIGPLVPENMTVAKLRDAIFTYYSAPQPKEDPQKEK